MSEKSVRSYMDILEARAHALRTASSVEDFRRDKSNIEEALRKYYLYVPLANQVSPALATELNDTFTRTFYSYKMEVKQAALDTNAQEAGYIMFAPITTHQQDYDRAQTLDAQQHAQEMQALQQELYGSPPFYKSLKFWGITLGVTTAGFLTYYLVTKD